jgi:AAA domain
LNRVQDFSTTPIKDLLEIDSFQRASGRLSAFLGGVGLSEATWDRAVSLFRNWQEVQRLTAEYTLYEVKREELLAGLQRMIECLGEMLHFKLRHAPRISAKLVHYSVVFDQHKYGYKGFDVPLHCFIVLSTHPADDDLETLLGEIQRRGFRPDVCMVNFLGNIPEPWVKQSRRREYYLVILGEREIKQIALSGSALLTFKSIIATTVDIMRIQPFEPHGPVKPYMFRGRQSSLSLLLRETHRCYALVGPRQIGKTALMDKVHREIERQPNTKVLRISCKRETPLALLLRLLRDLGMDAASQELSEAYLLLSGLVRSVDYSIVFMIDEADDVVAADRSDGYRLFWKLRNLWNETAPRCRFLFAGYQTLAAAVNEYDAPFFNFATPLVVGPLKSEDAQSLICEPLCEDLGINFSAESLIREITNRVNSHPSLIQHFCLLLIEHLRTEENRSVVEPEDIAAVLEDSRYRDRVLAVFWQRSLTTLQRLLASVMAASERRAWTSRDLMCQLSKYELALPEERVRASLEGMVIAGLCAKSRPSAFASQLYAFVNDLIWQHLQSRDLAGVFAEQVKHEDT